MGTSLEGPLRPDGLFTINGAPAGRYRIETQFGAGYYAESMQISGARSVEGQVYVEPESEFTINMVVNDNAGKVGGTAVRGEAPAAAVLVLLVPREKELADLRTFAYQTESDGSFEWDSVPPGTYYLMAVEDTGLEYKNRRLTEPLFKDARLLQLEPRAAYREKVPVIR